MPSKYVKEYATRTNRIREKLNPADVPTKSELSHYLHSELCKAKAELQLMMSDGQANEALQLMIDNGRASERAMSKQKEIVKNLTTTIQRM
jgi:hypothetical protein